MGDPGTKSSRMGVFDLIYVTLGVLDVKKFGKHRSSVHKTMVTFVTLGWGCNLRSFEMI